MLVRLRRLLARRPEPLPELPEIRLRPIGVVRNRIRKPGDWRHWREVTSRIVLRPDLADALLGLDGFSHVLVLFWPHLIPLHVLGSKHRLHPRDDPTNPLQGVLATRSQIRFNPILVTAVRLSKVKGNVVTVKGLDAVDGTPVLDLKPYLPAFDSVAEATVPEWVTRQAER